MSFELERAFGRHSRPGLRAGESRRASNGEAGGTLGWPVMQPLSGLCGSAGGACIPNPTVLRWDDIAASQSHLSHHRQQSGQLSRQADHRGQHGFHPGYYHLQKRRGNARGECGGAGRWTAAAIRCISTRSASSPARYFNGNHGNPVTGYDDANGNPLTMWGSNEPHMQGFFDLSGMPLPPGVTTANYQVTFEAVNPLYILTDSVGPYLDGSPEPSGTLAPISVSVPVGGQRADAHRECRRTRRWAARTTPSEARLRRACWPASGDVERAA